MPGKPGGLVVWGGGSLAPARERQAQGAAVVCWPGAPAAALAREGISFPAVEDVLGPEWLAAAVVVRLGEPGAGDADRTDAGPRPAATLDWAKGADPRPVAARLLAATRGRVEAR